MPRFVNLVPELVEKGNIQKEQIALLGDYEIGTLILSSFSKIKKHEHKDDWELYVETPRGSIIGLCDIGKKHELDNDTNESKYVIYIKGKNGAQKCEILSPEVEVSGNIQKRKIVAFGDYEIGIISLAPFSKIEKHEHTDEWEIYKETPWGRLISVCNVGQSHALENKTYHSLDVLYIKGRNGVPLPDNEEIKDFII